MDILYSGNIEKAISSSSKIIAKFDLSKFSYKEIH